MNFADTMQSHLGCPLTALGTGTLQVNVGTRCNLGCKHCHMDAGPTGALEMSPDVADAVLAAMSAHGIGTLDITGGAPELNPSLPALVTGARALGATVMVRTNLTALAAPEYSHLPAFFASHGVELVASLPHYSAPTVDRVRGPGAFRLSMDVMRTLNTLGYGTGALSLSLAYNPAGAFMPPAEHALSEDFRRELGTREGVRFDRLFTLANMPIGRFRAFLESSGQLSRYIFGLSGAFNPCTFDGLMCRHLVSVGHDGRLYDCDFNLALGIPVTTPGSAHITEFDPAVLASRRIAVDDHCFGCTAGQGST
jgi:radical SAM/Cys-rich protein